MAEKRTHPLGYGAAHMLVRKVKGRAGDLPCSTDACERQAYDWAYTGPGAFSRNTDDYVALCRPCHRQHDDASHGEGHCNAKLTEQAVREIRQRSSEGESQRSLARTFGVSQPAIHQLITGRTWKHITH